MGGCSLWGCPTSAGWSSLVGGMPGEGPKARDCREGWGGNPTPEKDPILAVGSPGWEVMVAEGSRQAESLFVPLLRDPVLLHLKNTSLTCD